MPSLIYKKQPEIVCDAPSRTDPGIPIPLFLLIKDAHLFPVQLDAVVVHVSYEGGVERIARFPYGGLKINSMIWWDSINITPEYTGIVKIDAYVLLKIGKKRVTVHVDNYNGLSHYPLRVFAASKPLPGLEGWYHGDIHCHTYYTSDQVEFGAPLEAMGYAAFCMGMQWMATTDHSYDLENTESSYTTDDPLLLKWRMIRQKAEMLFDSLTVIPGEEVTCSTHKGRNCHLLAINASKFIKGTGDSGKHGLFNTKTEKSIGEAVYECVEWGGIACAAHPLEKIPLLERIFLGRGEWTLSDLETSGITALQIYNGVRDRGFKRGMSVWTRLLLDGRRIFIMGGNDAHGDLNRRRRVWFPFLSISEENEHIFGNVRTVVRAKSKAVGDIVEALRKGHAVVTDGPFINLEVTSKNKVGWPGDEVHGGKISVSITVISSSEFGSLKEVRVIAGIQDKNIEKILMAKDILTREFEFTFTGTYESKNFLYIRTECVTVLGKICLTNPVWITGE